MILYFGMHQKMIELFCPLRLAKLPESVLDDDDEEAGADWAIGFPDAAFSVAPRSLFMHSLSNKKKRKQNQD